MNGKSKKLLILGANNPHVIRSFEQFQKVNSEWELIGFLDNDPKKKNEEFMGYKVLGGSKLITDEKYKDCYLVNVITRDVQTRKKTTDELIEYGAKFANLIHPSVSLHYVKLGVGLYIQDGVILQAGVKVDDHVSIHLGTNIAHETSIGKYCFIAYGVNIGGKVVIEDQVFVGAGAIIFPRISIGKGAQIGAGSVVSKDIKPNTVVMGNPARLIKKLNLE